MRHRRDDVCHDKGRGRGGVQGIWLVAAVLATGGGFACQGQEEIAVVETEVSPAGAPSLSDGPVAPGSETDKELCIRRSDRVSTITVVNGDWGSWASCPNSCPEGSFAYGVSQRVEPWTSALFVDETAMNGVKLNCNDRVTGAWTGNVTSHQGSWGRWFDVAMCPGGTNVPMVGGKVRYESPGHSDETTLNQLFGRCGLTGTTDLPVSSASAYGTWRAAVDCPSGTAVCGITTRVESNQGVAGDDTALNGVKFECCRFCPVGMIACGPSLTCMAPASCNPVVK